MARYDFTKLSVLIVEDSNFMRSLLIGVLRALGVERISVAEDGEKAIQIMQPVQNSASMVGMSGIDVILCDYFMPNVDGALFLRWIRRSEQSPDRFLPFIMVSAAADRDVLFTSRDAGMDEFVAKPFSVEMLAKRFTSIVEHPRPFIYSPSYFGPDRRRRKVPVDRERRVIPESEIETVYSGKDLAALKKSKKKVWRFKIPRNLKNKISTGATGQDEPAFDPDLLKAAEDKIQDMASDYADWVTQSIEELVQAHHRALEDLEDAGPHMVTIADIAHELRGQGGIFGYPLMTQFGKSLFEITNGNPTVTAPLLDLINAHIDLIKVVVKQKVKGDGGDVGKQLMTSLAQAKKKHAGG